MVKGIYNPNTPMWTNLEVAIRAISSAENSKLGFPPGLDILIRGNTDKESCDAKVSQDWRSTISEAIFDLWKCPMKHKYIILSNLDELFWTAKGECLLETHHVARVANHLVDILKMITDCNIKVMVMCPFKCGPTENLDTFLEATRLMVDILVSNPDLIGKWTREITIFQTSEWLRELCTTGFNARYSKEKLLEIENGQVIGWTKLGVCEVSSRLSENLRNWMERDLNPESKPIHLKQPVSLLDLSKVLGCQYVVNPSPPKGKVGWGKSIASPTKAVVESDEPLLDMSTAAWAQAKAAAALKKKKGKKQLLGPNTKNKGRPDNQPNMPSASPPRRKHRKHKRKVVGSIPVSKGTEQPWDVKPFSGTQR